MSDRPPARSTALMVATVAVMTAVSAVFTIMVRIPIPATKGYFNLSDVAVYFTAFALGPFAGAVAGGLGTALADVVSGFPQWAPVSLVAHGLEGLVAGLIAGRFSGRRSAPRWVAASVAGSVVMVGLYLAGGAVLVGGAAVAEIPFNVVQTAVGAVLGSALALVVYRAYPPVRDLRW